MWSEAISDSSQDFLACLRGEAQAVVQQPTPPAAGVGSASLAPQESAVRCDSVGVMDEAAPCTAQPHWHLNWAQVALKLLDPLRLEVLFMGSLEVLLISPLLVRSSILPVLLSRVACTDHRDQALLDFEGHLAHVVVLEQDGCWQCCTYCALDSQDASVSVTSKVTPTGRATDELLIGAMGLDLGHSDGVLLAHLLEVLLPELAVASKDELVQIIGGGLHEILAVADQPNVRATRVLKGI